MLWNHLLAYSKNHGFQKYFYNTGWLFLTHGVRLIVGLFVGLLLARYLGPESYGVYNYVMIMTMVVSSVVRFGTEDQVIKNLVMNSEGVDYQLNEAFWLRLLLGLVAIVIIYSLKLFFSVERSLFYILICSVGVLFQSFEVIDLYYRATVQIKISSVFRIVQVLLSSLVKLVLIITNADLSYFFYVYIFDCVSYSVPLYALYIKNYKDFLLFNIRYDKVVSLMRQCFPLMLATTASILLSKIDQIMVVDMMGKASGGYYAAACKVLEIVSVIPTLIMMSLFTAVVNAKKVNRSMYIDRFRQLACLLLWFSLLSGLALYVLSPVIINLLFSDKYLPSVDVLKYFSIHLLTTTFMTLNTKWFILEGKNHIVMIKVFAAMLLNWGISFLLIPNFGFVGAIWGAVLSHAIIFFAFDLFFKETRQAFFINLSFFYFKGLSE